MITLDLTNVFTVGETHGLRETDFRATAKNLTAHLTALHERKQGFYRCIDDEDIVANIESFAASRKGLYDDIVVLGIGGSSLGAITLRDSFGDFLQQKQPRLHVLENIDPDFLRDIEALLNLKKTLFIAISKSGTTPEVLAEYFYFRKKIEDAQLPPSEHFVMVTDPQKGLFRSIADRDGIPTFTIPGDIGGRFSVLTPVGLLPAALIGIDIRKLLIGARSMRDRLLSEDFEENLPYQMATAQFLLAQKGITNHVIFPYSTRLRTFSDWCVQLIAESTGKKNIQGIPVGITPIAALGVTDQHSQTQLFVEGPFDKLVTFIAVAQSKTDMPIPLLEDNKQTKYLRGVSFGTLLRAELQGTRQSYTEHERPNILITLPNISESALGELILLWEGMTAFLGEMLQINAFDQPGVERSKVITREILG